MVKKNQLSKWMLGSAVAGLVVSGGIFQHNVLSVGYSVAHAEEQAPAKDEKAKDEKTAKDEKAPAKDEKAKDEKTAKDEKAPAKDEKAKDEKASKEEKAKDEKTAKTKDASCGQGNCGANMKDEKAKTN
ncbi:MAG: hypothetical protein HYU97_10070 [Deltaproteobacteria bacterium]|nr:hypothetical protein [Deltaproteobacteria bacterium]